MFLVLGGTAGLVYQVLGPDEVRGAEVARVARLSASAASAALRVLAEHGLAERGPGGWRRGAAALAGVAESTGAAALQREREERYRKDRESWRARLRQYQAARLPVTSRDGWLGLDDDEDGPRCSRAGGRCSEMTLYAALRTWRRPGVWVPSASDRE